MNTTRLCSIIFLAFIFFAVGACSTHTPEAKTITPESKYPSIIARSLTNKRSCILHSGINVYNVTSVQVDHGKQQMTVQLNKPDSSQLAFYKGVEAGNYHHQKGEAKQGGQTHIFMADSTSYTLDEPHTLPLNKVAKVEVVQ
jgi:hypothetical protein